MASRGVLLLCACLGSLGASFQWLSAVGPSNGRDDPGHRPVVTLRIIDVEPLLFQGFRVTLRFRNWTAEPLTVFRPRYGSHDGQSEPHYAYEVEWPDGQRHRPDCSWCRPGGFASEPVWPSDYAIELPPFSARTLTDEPPLPHGPPGRHVVSCSYEFGSSSSEPVAQSAWRGRTNTAQADVSIPQPASPR